MRLFYRVGNADNLARLPAHTFARDLRAGLVDGVIFGTLMLVPAYEVLTDPKVTREEWADAAHTKRSLTLREAAFALDISETSVRMMIRAGALIETRHQTGGARVSVQSILDLAGRRPDPRP